MTAGIPEPAEYRQSGGTGELCSRIGIRATPRQIWDTLTAFLDYPSWNPFIPRISGALVVGQKITVHLKPEGMPGMTIHPKLLAVDPCRELRWAGHLGIPGLFDAEHIFEIQPLDRDLSLFIQRERFTGLLLPFFAVTLKDGTARGFSAMNAALRERAEQAPAAVQEVSGDR